MSEKELLDIEKDKNRELNEKLSKALSDLEKQKKEYKRLSDSYRKLSCKYEEVSFLHTQVMNSFAWKMTWPWRKCGAILRKIKFIYYPLKAMKILFMGGPRALAVRLRGRFGSKRISCSFKISKKRRKFETATVFEKNIKISVLVPLYNTPIKFLQEMIDSVKNQTYKNWELCLADGSDNEHLEVGEYVKKLALSDSRIVYKKLDKNLGISENTNACIDISSGDYIALFDHDDLLHPSALYRVMKEIENGADFVYTDEATFTGKNPSDILFAHFKADFAPDTLRSYNYICHLSVFSRELLEKVGKFRKECDGSQDYDMILRLTEKAEKIVHIPEILYFWRGHKDSTAQDIGSKPYIIGAAHKALSDHLKRQSLKGEVLDSKVPSTYRIKYDIKDEPLVSIIIANKDEVASLDTCISSIFEKSTYRNFEIIIAENNSTEEETFAYYEEIKKVYQNIKIVVWNDKFNYSKINNFGFDNVSGEYVILLNNDVEIISENWIEEMLMYAQRSDVGAVGAILYYPDDTIQHAGVILGIGGVAGHSHKNFKRGEYGYMTRAAIAQNLSAVTFACVMIPSAVFRETGGLDEKFEVAFNDVDMCMRIRKAGYLIVFTPYAELYHYESKSRGSEDTPQKIKRFNSEIDRFKARWGKELESGDPYYNPNLTLTFEDFSYKTR